MFNIFKKKEKVPEAPKCTCGAWPDPSWTHADFLSKHERVKLCPIHKDLKMTMVVTRTEAPIPTPVPVEPILTLVEELGQQIRAARIHLLNATECLDATNPLWKELNDIIEHLEKIIQEQK